ncbi:MAG: fused MFS/spermidine synthase [Magnetococcales bacterium]|nr:fused MFS/spermidine synthase [Magnetococcales bacterium]
MRGLPRPERKRLLYRQLHGGRVITVVEDYDSRTLAFDSHLTQSRMSLDDPNALVLRYTRRMMAGLMFLESAACGEVFRVLMIGLGGGSLAKFLLHHFAGCRMDVVENDPQLPVLARQFFHLPNDPRLKVIVEAGGRFMERISTGESLEYDLILLDAFDEVGMAREVYADSVFARAHGRLSAQGVLVINLIRSDATLFRHGTESIRHRFPGAVMGLAVPGFNNELLFAGPGVMNREREAEMERRAHALEQRTGMNFSGYLREMTRLDTPVFWKRLLGCLTS